MSKDPVDIYIAYAAADAALLERLRIQLVAAERIGMVDAFHDGEVAVGTDREAVMLEALRRSPIIVLLLSADFLASEFAYEKELKIALERQAAGTAKVIPVLLSACTWQYTPLAQLEVLPKGKIPVTDARWQNPDQAFIQVVEEILEGINEDNNAASASVDTPPIPENTIPPASPTPSQFPTISINGLEWMQGDLMIAGSENPTPEDSFFDFKSAQAACPEGWRLPTKAEWKAMSSEQLQLLKLRRAGLYDRGYPRDAGRKGYYWSSERSFGGEAWCLEWRSGDLGVIESRYDHWQLSCRCVR